MSGTFMDGGNTLMDGGNTFADGGHDHGSIHHSGGQDGYNGGGGDSMHNQQGDGSALGNLLSHSAQNHHGFLAHLLGLDHDGADHGASHMAHGAQPTHASQTAIWTSALQSMKLSDFTSGLSFTPAMGMFFLFAGFVGWLFLLYAIRHNEPLANSILGTTPASQGPSAYCSSADRRIIDATRAMPIPTETLRQDHQPPVMSNFDQQSQRNEADSATQDAAPLGLLPAPAQAAPQPIFSVPTSSSSATATSGMTDSYTLPAGVAPPSSVNSYAVSTVNNGAGRKLKFIVNN
ncbi:MAG TPA: hypothetical protein V6C97_20230 [Oculatellaceae cyanobacterium]